MTHLAGLAAHLVVVGAGVVAHDAGAVEHRGQHGLVHRVEPADGARGQGGADGARGRMAVAARQRERVGNPARDVVDRVVEQGQRQVGGGVVRGIAGARLHPFDAALGDRGGGQRHHVDRVAAVQPEGLLQLHVEGQAQHLLGAGQHRPDGEPAQPALGPLEVRRHHLAELRHREGGGLLRRHHAAHRLGQAVEADVAAALAAQPGDADAGGRHAAQHVESVDHAGLGGHLDGGVDRVVQRALVAEAERRLRGRQPTRGDQGALEDRGDQGPGALDQRPGGQRLAGGEHQRRLGRAGLAGAQAVVLALVGVQVDVGRGAMAGLHHAGAVAVAEARCRVDQAQPGALGAGGQLVHRLVVGGEADDDGLGARSLRAGLAELLAQRVHQRLEGARALGGLHAGQLGRADDLPLLDAPDLGQHRPAHVHRGGRMFQVPGGLRAQGGRPVGRRGGAALELLVAFHRGDEEQALRLVEMRGERGQAIGQRRAEAGQRRGLGTGPPLRFLGHRAGVGRHLHDRVVGLGQRAPRVQLGVQRQALDRGAQRGLHVAAGQRGAVRAGRAGLQIGLGAAGRRPVGEHARAFERLQVGQLDQPVAIALDEEARLGLAGQRLADDRQALGHRHAVRAVCGELQHVAVVVEVGQLRARRGGGHQRRLEAAEETGHVLAGGAVVGLELGQPRWVGRGRGEHALERGDGVGALDGLGLGHGGGGRR